MRDVLDPRLKNERLLGVLVFILWTLFKKMNELRAIEINLDRKKEEILTICRKIGLAGSNSKSARQI